MSRANVALKQERGRDRPNAGGAQSGRRAAMGRANVALTQILGRETGAIGRAPGEINRAEARR